MSILLINTQISSMTTVFRKDNFSVGSVHIDSFGILRAKARIARIGIQEYYEDGKIIRELRLPEDVEASAESFSQQIVTLDHPSDFVDANNAKDYSKGLTGSVTYKDGFLEAQITITHADAVEAAKTTHRQFSCGYYAELVEDSGVWIDELGVQGKAGKEYQYDRIQRNIVGNHIAVVPLARAGNKATFFDGFTINQENKTVVENMVKFVHKDSIYEIEGADAARTAELVASLRSELETERNDAADTLGNLEAENSRLKADNSSLVGKVEGLEAKVNEPKLDADEITLEVQSRLDAWQLVEPHLKDVKRDNSLSAIEIQKLYLKQALPQLAEKIDSADQNYILGLWDAQKPEPTPLPSTSDVAKSLLKDAGNKPMDEDALTKALEDYKKSRSGNK